VLRRPIEIAAESSRSIHSISSDLNDCFGGKRTVAFCFSQKILEKTSFVLREYLKQPNDYLGESENCPPPTTTLMGPISARSAKIRSGQLSQNLVMLGGYHSIYPTYLNRPGHPILSWLI